MSGETQNRAEIARIVSNDIFAVFGWNREKPSDENWPCTQGHHGEDEYSTHPTDLAFWYEDPYYDRRLYLNTDLKSYAADSISKTALSKALRSLAAATHCANISEHWSTLFASNDTTYSVAGLLFIFNHDGAYDKEFASLLEQVDYKTVGIEKRTKLYVLSPQRISYISTVAQDIRLFRAEQLGANGRSAFFYPDLVRARPRSNSMSAASIESLLGPWLVLKYSGAKAQGARVYYSGTGATSDEFVYLIDFLFRSGLLDEGSTVTIQMVFADEKALIHFSRAKEHYPRQFEPYSVHEVRRRVDQVSCELLSHQKLVFNPLNIGMTRA